MEVSEKKIESIVPVPVAESHPRRHLGATNLPAPTFTVRRLQSCDQESLEEFVAHSRLAGLRPDGGPRRLLDEAVVLGVRHDGRLIGCSCFYVDHKRSYRNFAGQSVTLPSANIYLCGTEVAAQYRQRGVGTALYRARLALASRYARPLFVEILGAGTAGTIDAAAVVGFRFHIANGFTEVSSSLEGDAGPILRR